MCWEKSYLYAQRRGLQMFYNSEAVLKEEKKVILKFSRPLRFSSFYLIVPCFLALILFCLLSFGICGILCKERVGPSLIAIEILNLCFVFICIKDTSKFITRYTNYLIVRATIPSLTYFMVCMIELLISSEYKLRYSDSTCACQYILL